MDTDRTMLGPSRQAAQKRFGKPANRRNLPHFCWMEMTPTDRYSLVDGSIRAPTTR